MLNNELRTIQVASSNLTFESFDRTDVLLINYNCPEEPNCS